MIEFGLAKLAKLRHLLPLKMTQVDSRYAAKHLMLNKMGQNTILIIYTKQPLSRCLVVNAGLGLVEID